MVKCFKSDFFVGKHRVNYPKIIPILVISFVAFSSFLWATDVGGLISTNTTWDLNGSPYVVISSVIVQSGVILTIEAGVEVRFQEGKSLRVDGDLIARGTDGNNIVFTSDNSVPASGDWGGLMFTDSCSDAVFNSSENYLSGAILEYCTLKFGGQLDGIILLNNCSPYINFTTIEHADSFAIHTTAPPNLHISNCNISYTKGIYIDGGQVEVKNNYIFDNTSDYSGGGIHAKNCTANIENNVIENNTSLDSDIMGRDNHGGGIFASGDIAIKSNLIKGNHSEQSAGGIYAYSGTIHIENNWIIENTCCCDGGGIYSYSQLAMVYIIGNILRKNHSGESAGGIRTDSPSQIEKNYFDENDSDGYGGGIHIYSGNAAINENIFNNNTSSNNGAGIIVKNVSTPGRPSQAFSIINNTFSGNFCAQAGKTSGIHSDISVDGDQIKRNTFFGHDGNQTVYLNDNKTELAENNFQNEQTSYSLYFNGDSLQTLNAENNWWDSSDDATIQDRIYDWNDNSSVGFVDYVPFLPDINLAAPISPPSGLQMTSSSIKALLGNTEIPLTWTANPESDTAGYKVYWDTDPGYPYANLVDVGDVTMYTLTGLDPSKNYYIAITAYDTDYAAINDDLETIVNENQTSGHESWYSEEAGDYTLIVNVLPDGAGTITKSPDKAYYTKGETIELTVTTNIGFTFTGWTGDVPSGHEGDNPLTITMDTSKTLTANFTVPTYILTTQPNPSGGGTISRNPDKSSYTYGDVVELSANENAGYAFTGWTGDVPSGHENDNPLTLTMIANKFLTANFTPGQYTLNVEAVPGAGGSVTKNPDKSVYAFGDSVQLMANSVAGFTFEGWTGDVSAGQEANNPLTIDIDGDKSLSAHFKGLAVNLDDAVVIYIDHNSKLLKIDEEGNVLAVISSDPDVDAFYFSPDKKLFVVFAEKQPVVTAATVGYYLLVRANPTDNIVTGIDTDLTEVVWNTDSVSPNIQFDGSGNVYYLAKGGNGVLLRKYVNETNKTDLINEDIEVRHWLVREDGTVVIAGMNKSTQSEWLRKITPANAIFPIASPAFTGWILDFPDGQVYTGMPLLAPYHGVYKLAPDLPYLSAAEAQSPFIGYSSEGYTPDYDVDTLCAGITPNYVQGFKVNGGVNLFDFAATADNKIIGLTGSGLDRTVVSLYPIPKVIELQLVDRITVMKESHNQLVIPGSKDGTQKLIIYDLPTGNEMNILDENIDIYHLDVLSNGSILFDGLKFSDNSYVVGMFGPAVGTAGGPSIDLYSYRELASLDGKPKDFATLDRGEVEAQKDDLLGTWPGQGVYYCNSNTKQWVKLAIPASKISCGDLDEDGIDDLIGIWLSQSGIWTRYSSTEQWFLLSSTADCIGSGDMDGDGRDDLIGTWMGQGVYYRNSANGQWVKMATPADKITCGDLDLDGTDDLIGIWASQGGVWVKYSATSNWERLSSKADWISCGDMNGDGKDDLLGTWAGQGVFYRDMATGTWYQMATAASQITCGDLDGDGIDDLVGMWAGQDGVWVKYSSDSSWEKLSSTADWIACGKMRDSGTTSAVGDATALGGLKDQLGGLAEIPFISDSKNDASAKGPGGSHFIFSEQPNLFPLMNRNSISKYVPGPGEPGFECVEQSNLIPGKHKKKSGRKDK